LSKQPKRKKQRASTTPQPSKVIFTFAAVRMLKDALRLVDEAFERNTRPMPNLQFGLETLRELQAKIDKMLQSEDWDHETLFDYNELHLLYGAIHMYLVDLTFDNNAELTPACLQICKQITRAVEALPPKYIKPLTDN
jgi:hypothetical protein